ncbi:MAG: hypothetical protein AAF600_06105 [Bacteroidota bacterium]
MPNITIANLKSKTIQCENKREKLLDVLPQEIDQIHVCYIKEGSITDNDRIIFRHGAGSPYKVRFSRLDYGVMSVGRARYVFGRLWK